MMVSEELHTKNYHSSVPSVDSLFFLLPHIPCQRRQVVLQAACLGLHVDGGRPRRYEMRQLQGDPVVEGRGGGETGKKIIISLLRHDRYKNKNTRHNTIELTITKFPVYDAMRCVSFAVTQSWREGGAAKLERCGENFLEKKGRRSWNDVLRCVSFKVTQSWREEGAAKLERYRDNFLEKKGWRNCNDIGTTFYHTEKRGRRNWEDVRATF